MVATVFADFVIFGGNVYFREWDEIGTSGLRQLSLYCLVHKLRQGGCFVPSRRGKNKNKN